MTAKWRVRAATTAAMVIVTLVLPATSGAHGSKATGRRGKRSVVTTLALKGSNGYLLTVILLNRRTLKITATPDREQLLEHLFEGASTEYSVDAPQPRGSTGIKASLGRFGRIDLRFVPEEEVEEAATLFACKGEKQTAAVGRFVGTFDFRGERGYTQVRATHADGATVNIPKPFQKCHSTDDRGPQERSPQKRARVAMIAAARKAASSEGSLLVRAKRASGNRKVSFEAIRSAAKEKGKLVVFDTFSATASRDRGRIQETGTAFDLFVRGPFFKVPDLTLPTSEAVIEPPRPFLGTATLRREPTGKVRWDGDLRVELPGFGAVQLAGPAFKTSICADLGCGGDR